MKVIDNFLEQKDAEYVNKYCLAASYTYGERDSDTTPPTGMVHEIENTHHIYNYLIKKYKKYLLI